MTMRAIKGKKIGKDGMFPEASERKGDIMFPSFYISIEHLPEAKNWEIGKEYAVALKLRMTGLSVRKNETRKTDYGDATFEITGIDPNAPVKVEKKAVKKPEKRYSRVAKK